MDFCVMRDRSNNPHEVGDTMKCILGIQLGYCYRVEIRYLEKLPQPKVQIQSLPNAQLWIKSKAYIRMNLDQHISPEWAVELVSRWLLQN